MIRTLVQLLKTGNVTQQDLFPDLPDYDRGLPRATSAPCGARDGCHLCLDACPTEAIKIEPNREGARVTLDRGQCLACGGCTDVCPSGTLIPDRRTDVAVRLRSELLLSNSAVVERETRVESPMFRRSIHLREVSTGDSASDLETAAANNPMFDASRFGIHFVASPRFADALLVTGPVARAMQEPLRRCYAAMAEPRLVIAAGASAISGQPFSGGYAQADGVDAILPVSVYIPGNPPHPWAILHGIMTAMGSRLPSQR